MRNRRSHGNPHRNAAGNRQPNQRSSCRDPIKALPCASSIIPTSANNPMHTEKGALDQLNQPSPASTGKRLGVLPYPFPGTPPPSIWWGLRARTRTPPRQTTNATLAVQVEGRLPGSEFGAGSFSTEALKAKLLRRSTSLRQHSSRTTPNNRGKGMRFFN